MLTNLTYLTHLIASAGGGGSSSGGGGGGSGSGGGGIVSLIMVILFALSMWLVERLSHLIQSCIPTTKSQDNSTLYQLLTWSLAVILIIIVVVFSLQVMYGFSILMLSVPISAGIICGAGQGLYGWFDKIKTDKQTKVKLAKAAAKNKLWQEDYLKNGATTIYKQYQADWSNFDLANCKKYLTDRYYHHVSLMLAEFRAMKRRNKTRIVEIKQLEITNMQEAQGDAPDMFVAGISASITDQLIDETTNQVLYEKTFDSDEYWRFLLDGNSWRLDGIRPATATETVKEQQIEAFATKAGAYYSLDWGRLLIPQRGQLFGRGAMNTSDINNHVIGKLQDTGRSFADSIIYQIYTYSRSGAESCGRIYLVGQITVPKYYGNILIRHRKGLFQFGVKGLREMSMEWADFNKKYQVFAESTEQTASFELLNPQMMQWLEATTFDTNIEVIDNSIYFYASLKSVTADNYETMLGILQGAYRELKM